VKRTRSDPVSFTRSHTQHAIRTHHTCNTQRAPCNTQPSLATSNTQTNPSTISPDALATLPASARKPIDYPPFEPPLSTDLMSSVALTGTNHGEGEAVHLRVMRGVSLALSPRSTLRFFSSFSLKVLIFLAVADGEKGEKEEEEDADVDTQETPRAGACTYTRTWGRMRGCCNARVRRGCMIMCLTTGGGRSGECGGAWSFSLFYFRAFLPSLRNVPAYTQFLRYRC
jgi:hypothetical protein